MRNLLKYTVVFSALLGAGYAIYLGDRLFAWAFIVTLLTVLRDYTEARGNDK